ncbi:MAG: beta-ketoacyl-ACP synthase III [Gammaproteobacteria bacterium]|nr:beta-ketoacyl-ACP synthase III [Gammaproteobacteria bacterium]
MTTAVLTGTGHSIPPYAVSNEELVTSFNQYVTTYNKEHQEAIRRGEKEALPESSVEFIVKASGIHNRYFLDKTGILDPTRMCPHIPFRTPEEPSIQAEVAVKAAQEAIRIAGKTPGEFDMVISACSTTQRNYPAISIEVQKILGIAGAAFDMNVACSSATFAVQLAVDSIRGGHAKAVLVVNPEVMGGNLNFRDRESHFIFGEACTAMVIERKVNLTAPSPHAFLIQGTRLLTDFSNNIRNEFGCLTPTYPKDIAQKSQFFTQNGKKVFKEVTPLAASLIQNHLEAHHLTPKDIKRFWLHQANLHMNTLIIRKLLEREGTSEEAPIVLDRFANTGACGSVLAFHFHHTDFKPGELGLLSSFGAGYSVGSVILEKV